MNEASIGTSMQQAILEALGRGNNVEIRRNRDGIVIYEVRKKIISRITDHNPVPSGEQEEPKGALTG